jgi:hypothetical protein
MIHIVDKRTGTYGDSLEAIGWGTLMEEMGVRKVEIRDEGSRFLVRGNGDLNVERPARLGFWFVVDQKNPAPKGADWVLDYDLERGKEEAIREYQKTTKKNSKTVARAQESGDLVAPDPPKPELRLAKMISSMRKGWNADRELAHWIGEHSEETRDWILAAADGKAYTKAPDLSNTQLLNPATGKGVSGAKTLAKSPGSIPNILVDPFSEWMKLRGMWRAMLAYRSDDDFKFMVIEPGWISPEGMKLVRTTLDGLALWGGVRLDIEATLRCTQALIVHSEAVSLTGRTPRTVIAGLRQAFFKSLGTAAALMNEALLPLPDWFVVRNREDADVYLDIIRETIGENVRGGCLGALNEENSDEGAVLQQYRAWLATGDFGELMDFHYQFAAMMMRKAASGDYTRAFSTEILDALFIRTYEETQMLKEIVENEGFNSLARAIRNTTIYAVGMKNSDRDVQFGLAQKWKQKMKGRPGEFSSAVAEFVQANNWEVVYRLKGRGHQVTTSDLDQVCELIENHGEEKVGSLLLAYGYSRAPKVDNVGEGTQQQEILSV